MCDNVMVHTIQIPFDLYTKHYKINIQKKTEHIVSI